MNNGSLKYKEITRVYAISTDPGGYRDSSSDRIEKAMNAMQDKGWKIKDIAQAGSHKSSGSYMSLIMTVVYYTDDYTSIKSNNNRL